MPTAAQYQHRIDELNLGLLDQPSPATEAITELENQLNQLVQDLTREIQVIRTQYHTRISSANAGGSSGRILASNKQAGSAQRRADEVARLETERDEKIAPYQEVRQKVEDLVVRLTTGQSKS